MMDFAEVWEQEHSRHTQALARLEAENERKWQRLDAMGKFLDTKELFKNGEPVTVVLNLNTTILNRPEVLIKILGDDGCDVDYVYCRLEEVAIASEILQLGVSEIAPNS